MSYFTSLKVRKFIVKQFFYITTFFLFIANFPVKAGDPQFTQFFSVPLYLSPSFAGATQQHRVSSVYRNQWTGIPGGYITYSLSYDHFFANLNSGVGAMLMRDYAGSGQLGSNTIAIFYSYDFQFLNNWHIRPGLSFDYLMYNLLFSRLRFSDQFTSDGSINPVTIETSPSNEFRCNIDAGTSTLIYTDKFWFGATVDHLFRPNVAFYYDKARTPLKYTYFGGATIIRKGRLLRPIDESVSVAFLYQQQADFKQLSLGLYWFKSPLVLGFWYRGIPKVNSDRGDALAILVGFKQRKFSIAYSYDFTISNLINSTYGAHELSIIYEFTTSRRKRIHAIPCPEF